MVQDQDFPVPQVRGFDQVIDFFSNIGARREAEMYVKMFRDVVPWRFAVVLISADTLEGSVREVALDLAYLSGMNLYPVIVLDNLQGTGGRLVPRNSGSEEQKELPQGQRIRKLARINAKLVDEVHAAGGQAAGIFNEIFSLRTPPADDPEFDFRRMVEHLTLQPIRKAVAKRHIPVISPVVMDRGGVSRVVSAEKVSKALCARIKPQKFIVMSEREGLVDTDGKLIKNIILSTDYKGLLNSGRLDSEALSQLDAGVRVLREVPDLTIQFASAGNLLQELFTVKGRGTYIRAGHEVRSASSFDELDIDKLHHLLEEGFGRTLATDYFKEPPHRIFYEQHYHGAIVVKPLEGDTFYLDKFVVGPRWQGEGMGAPLWRELTKHYEKIIWRASPGNPINKWYLDQAEGFQRTPEWNIYWIGLNPREVGKLIERVSSFRRTVL
jgi:bifunctional N-acetylglutamate synthase/kinase